MTTTTGLVISSPLSSEGGPIVATLDAQELRLALLYWDKFAWPTSNVLHVGAGAEEDFLEQAGLLIRPRVELDLLHALTTYGIHRSAAIAHVKAFLELNEREPGVWALAQGERSFLIDQGFAGRERSILLELYRAIPIPNKDVALEDILHFRNRRRDELLKLRNAIDDFYSEMLGSGDQEHQLRRRISEIQASCADVIRVCKESKNPFRLSDWKVSFSLSPAIGSALGAMIGKSFEMPEIGLVLGGLAGTSVKISHDWSLGGVSNRNSPYWYVGSFHNELF